MLKAMLSVQDEEALMALKAFVSQYNAQQQQEKVRVHVVEPLVGQEYLTWGAVVKKSLSEQEAGQVKLLIKDLAYALGVEDGIEQLPIIENRYDCGLQGWLYLEQLKDVYLADKDFTDDQHDALKEQLMDDTQQALIDHNFLSLTDDLEALLTQTKKYVVTAYYLINEHKEYFSAWCSLLLAADAFAQYRGISKVGKSTSEEFTQQTENDIESCLMNALTRRSRYWTGTEADFQNGRCRGYEVRPRLENFSVDESLVKQVKQYLAMELKSDFEEGEPDSDLTLKCTIEALLQSKEALKQFFAQAD